jgi:hypothetical protein
MENINKDNNEENDEFYDALETSQIEKNEESLEEKGHEEDDDDDDEENEEFKKMLERRFNFENEQEQVKV